MHNGNCAKLEEYQCIGSAPANATLIPGDDQGLTKNTERILVGGHRGDNSSRKCEYECNLGFSEEGGKCVPTKWICETGPQGEQRWSCEINKNKINLFDLEEGQFNKFNGKELDSTISSKLQQREEEGLITCIENATNYKEATSGCGGDSGGGIMISSAFDFEFPWWRAEISPNSNSCQLLAKDHHLFREGIKCEFVDYRPAAAPMCECFGNWIKNK